MRVCCLIVRLLTGVKLDERDVVGVERDFAGVVVGDRGFGFDAIFAAFKALPTFDVAAAVGTTFVLPMFDAFMTFIATAVGITTTIGNWWVAIQDKL